MLVCGSWLDRPLWMTMTSEVTGSVVRLELANRLVSNLSHVLTTIDTKDTNLWLQSVYMLVCGSWLDRPLWMTMTSEVTGSVVRLELANRLVSNLSHVLTTIDTKDTNLWLQSVYMLVCGSWLDRPLWMTMTSEVTGSVVRLELANRLVSNLSHVLTTIDSSRMWINY
ncbi:hypothetical protein J6590_023151 [Homalodisca vitripennis]|nr:hypothetical protein J6590_023151 [Homalodisca vitripennis]